MTLSDIQLEITSFKYTYNNFQLPPQSNRPSDVSKIIRMSLKEMGLDYIDMYLI